LLRPHPGFSFNPGLCFRKLSFGCFMLGFYIGFCLCSRDDLCFLSGFGPSLGLSFSTGFLLGCLDSRFQFGAGTRCFCIVFGFCFRFLTNFLLGRLLSQRSRARRSKHAGKVELISYRGRFRGHYLGRSDLWRNYLLAFIANQLGINQPLHDFRQITAQAWWCALNHFIQCRYIIDEQHDPLHVSRQAGHRGFTDRSFNENCFFVHGRRYDLVMFGTFPCLQKTRHQPLHKVDRYAFSR